MRKTIRSIKAIMLGLIMVMSIPMPTFSVHAEAVDLQEEVIAENEKYITENFESLLVNELITSSNQNRNSLSTFSLSSDNDENIEYVYKIQDRELLTSEVTSITF